MTSVGRASPPFVAVTMKGARGQAGSNGAGDCGSFSTPTQIGDELVVTVTSHWGIDSDGNPYYDRDGAVPAEAAIASLDDDGHLVLTTPEL